MMREPWLSATGPVLCVVGARPNFMKMAPILRALGAHDPALPALLVHTGQHYDADMNDQLFSGLQLPRPDVNLEVGSGTHAVQTAEVMRRFEPVLDAHRPSCVLVVGDVNSTLACTLVAVKKGVPVAHVEAGLRSFDRSMPEEINRVLTDQIADLLYTTERARQREPRARRHRCLACTFRRQCHDRLAAGEPGVGGASRGNAAAGRHRTFGIRPDKRLRRGHLAPPGKCRPGAKHWVRCSRYCAT